jgi:hypothetical protein
VPLAGGPETVTSIDDPSGSTLIDDSGRIALGVNGDDHDAIVSFMPEPNAMLSLFPAGLLLRILERRRRTRSRGC